MWLSHPAPDRALGLRVPQGGSHPSLFSLQPSATSPQVTSSPTPSGEGPLQTFPLALAPALSQLIGGSGGNPDECDSWGQGPPFWNQRLFWEEPPTCSPSPEPSKLWQSTDAERTTEAALPWALECTLNAPVLHDVANP